jgi:hypothetical protein
LLKYRASCAIAPLRATLRTLNAASRCSFSSRHSGSRAHTLAFMPRYVTLLGSVLILSLGAGVVSAWFRWLRQREKVTPKWRAGTILVGLCLATFSTALSIFLLVHAAFTGGYPFYHPVELFCIRFGGLTAILGIGASIAGKGTLRLHVAALSTLNLLLWVMDAAMQYQTFTMI